MTDRVPISRKGGYGPLLLRLMHGVLAAGFVINAVVVDENSAAHVQIGFFLIGVLGLWLTLDLARLVPSSFRKVTGLPRALVQQAERFATGRGVVRGGAGAGALSPLTRAMSWNLLLAFSAIFLTGWMMTTPMFWASGALEELHEFAVFWTGFSALAHVALVLWARARRAASLRGLEGQNTGQNTGEEKS